ncbi:hypothetical protein V8D89_003478 [Ganoderma adspersum]
MVTFILMPTFAISALLVGALPAAYAAPLSTNPRDSVALVNRGCRQAGCLLTTSDSSTSTSTTTSAGTAVATGSPASKDDADSAEDSPSSFAAVARAVGAGRPYAGVLPAVVNEKLSANQI